jgi:ribonucleotide reductase beta subunit family protein with ferritin-like domain
MYEDILKQAKENCNKRFNNEVIKNWIVQEYSPAHAYSYMYMCEAIRLMKEQYKTDFKRVSNERSLKNGL